MSAREQRGGVRCLSCNRLFTGIRELSEHAARDDCPQGGEVFI
jgi:predicted RNA-binding Zn-ribbon protein involved in translation (DUF1610 family)